MRDIIITTLALVFGGAVIYTAVLASQIPLGVSPTFITFDTIKPNVTDTPKVIPVTLTSVRGKKALFIGDLWWSK